MYKLAWGYTDQDAGQRQKLSDDVARYQAQGYRVHGSPRQGANNTWFQAMVGDDDVVGTWMAWNDSRVSQYIDFPGCTSLPGELMVRIGSDSIQVNGIIRKTFTSSERVLCRVLKPLPGTNIATAAYTHGIVSTRSITWSNYVSSSSYPVGIALEGNTVNGAWFMFNLLNIIFN